MDSRLKRTERNAVRNKFGDHDLFLFMQSPCSEYEKKSAKHKLSTDELFYECMIVLDKIKENPGDASLWMNSLWNDLYNSYNDPDADYDDEDLKTSVTEVVVCVACCLNVFGNRIYNKLNLTLMEQITKNYPNYEEMLHLYSSSIYKLGEERFREDVMTYMDSGDFYSDDISDLIQGIDTPDQLTITQSIFLFAGVLDISLDKAFTTGSKLAELIGKVTPYDAESIRTRNSELQKLLKKKPLSAKITNDIEKVAKILEEYNPKIANYLREEFIP